MTAPSTVSLQRKSDDVFRRTKTMKNLLLYATNFFILFVQKSSNMNKSLTFLGKMTLYLTSVLPTVIIPKLLNSYSNNVSDGCILLDVVSRVHGIGSFYDTVCVYIQSDRGMWLRGQHNVRAVMKLSIHE
mmetsp:Transcript_19090/g.27974  ORF Transcript_19090/g.27974 Transcript_19090/m.27974 type:complete len:130 (+) Transcript_19090:1321-1710(+)